MKILFLTLFNFDSYEESNIYTDLLREFGRHGHEIYAISPIERRENRKTYVIKEDIGMILRLNIGNIQKTNIIEKGFSMIFLESKFIKGIKKYFGQIKFDLIMYSTPPITLQKAVAFVKKRDSAKTYLLLKDIFPQNAVDMGMLRKNGIRGLLYRYFRNKEIRLYKISDYIGCMSPANVEYVLKHNSYLDRNKLHVSPNCIEVKEKKLKEDKSTIRKRYGIPLNVTTFIYGGNLGKPQGVPFILDCLRANENMVDRFFVICGSGTEFGKLKKYVDMKHPNNILLINGLPKDDYENLVAVCDVGLIFLDYKFTIPNFPSRILSYMENGLPVIACTDRNTDVGKIVEENSLGYWAESTCTLNFNALVKEFINMDDHVKREMGDNARRFLENNYLSVCVFGVINKHVKINKKNKYICGE